jgi:hypothetical protein
MRSFPRRTTLTIVIALVVVGALALPASAAQVIKYQGKTSQDLGITLRVLKKDNGRRFLQSFLVGADLECEDGSTLQYGFGLAHPPPGRRLAPDGGFELGRPFPTRGPTSLHAEGVVEFGAASGTVELRVRRSTARGDSQMCSSGVLDWTAERRKATPAKAAS